MAKRKLITKAYTNIRRITIIMESKRIDVIRMQNCRCKWDQVQTLQQKNGSLQKDIEDIIATLTEFGILQSGQIYQQQLQQHQQL